MCLVGFNLKGVQKSCKPSTGDGRLSLPEGLGLIFFGE